MPISILRYMKMSSRCKVMQSKLPLARIGSEVQKIPIRHKYYYIPPNQYRSRKTDNFDIFVVVRRNWEIIPLFMVTAFSLSVASFSVTFAIKHKMDTVFRTHSRDCISRTMNLDCPSNHKLITITQRYEPWRQMQAALDKMEAAEQRLARRVKVCGCDNDGSDF